VKSQIALPRVLILEDEWLLAELLEATVRGLGFDVAGPVPTVSHALELLAKDDVTMAVLDVSLGENERSYPVAHCLRERNIPFVFITGYLGTDLPDEFRNQPLLSKPLRAEMVGSKLKSMLATVRAGDA
jgi:CheY-like chemotaxis protein